MPALTAELVVDGRLPHSPALSPTGRLCFVLDTKLWIVENDTTRRVTADTTTESCPRWSPDDQLHFLSGHTPQLHDGTMVLTDWPAGIFAARVSGRVGLEEWSDVETGIDLLIDQGIADPDRLGIAGWSHGGFMAAWAVTQTNRFRAALVGAGISDWGMLAATGENGQFEAALGGSTGWEGPGPHPHDAVSPISFTRNIQTPVLILHGEEDTNVPLGQAVYLHRALKHHRIEHEFVIYPREGHSIRERAHQIDVLRRTRAWFDRWCS